MAETQLFCLAAWVHGVNVGAWRVVLPVGDK